MATVSEDGPFSIFPGVERNLTVLSGPGFRLMGDGIDLACAPFCPVAFPGDVTLTALDTGGNPSRDFNVMTARHLPRPEVTVLAAGVQTGPGWQALYPLAMGDANGSTLSPGDLYLTDKTIAFRGAGKAILVRLFGLDEALSALRS
jgi:uncharacterized protein